MDIRTQTMCGRYTVINEIEEIEQEFDVQMELPFAPVYNATPSTIDQPRALPIIHSDDPDTVNLCVWGIVPHWSKEAKVKFSNINARVENLSTSKVYRPLLYKQRCLVIANCYFEWQKTPEGKQPYVVYHRDHKYVAFAGLWDKWANKETGELSITYSIVTCPAEKELEHIHDRMPVILQPDDRKSWLDPGISMKTAMDILRRNANGRLNAYPVSTDVNRPANNNKEILAPIGKPVLPETRFKVSQRVHLEGMGGRRRDHKTHVPFWEQMGLQPKPGESRRGTQGTLDL